MNNITTIGANEILDITGVTYRASGNLFIAKQTCRTVPRAYSGTRGDVVAFTAGSGIRMRRYLRECRATYKFMVTLTYPGFFTSNGAESKNHLRRFLQELQRECIRNGKLATGELHSAFWFLEFQERGAPHYHIFTNWIPKKEWISKRWYEIVGSDDERHFRAGTNCVELQRGRSGTISYASKYAAKLTQKIAPPDYENCGRFWGVYGDRITMAAATFVSRRQAKDQSVSDAVDKLINQVKTCIDLGLGEVIKRDDGVLVVVIHDTNQMTKIRRLTSSISSKTMRFYDLFEDAEVDYGVIYDS